MWERKGWEGGGKASKRKGTLIPRATLRVEGLLGWYAPGPGTLRALRGGSRLVRLSVYLGALGSEQLLSGEYAPEQCRDM